MRTLMACTALLAATGALAADATLEQARRCADKKDSLERLVCYDTLFAAQPPVQPAPPPATAPAVPPAGAGAMVPPAAAAPPQAVPTAPSGGAVANADFGDEMVKRSVEEREEAAGPKTLSGTVQSLRETRPDVFRITLDNGQVWQQMDKDGLFHVKVGDTVQIDRGALGGYRMARTSNGRSGWVRVNRLK